ncbi:MAG TPA: tetratricopeptide repeat protein, partial [Chitinophagales bacterium]
GQKQYDKSTASFLRVVSIDSLLKLKGGKLPDELDVALDYAAAAAQNANDLPKAAFISEQLIAKYPDSSKYYHSLYRILVNQDKKAEAVTVVDKGLVKFPSDKDLLVDKVNSFFSENKPAEAIEYLKKLVAQDPKNEQLIAALGVAYENAGNNEEAVKTYQSLIDLNPNSYEGNYGRGTILFAKAKTINDQMNALGNTKADYAKYDALKIDRDKIFIESKPYFEKALTTKPDDSKAKQALTQINLLAQ